VKLQANRIHINFRNQRRGESDTPPQGYGISDLADDALSVISAMEIKRYLFVGHSMSGKVAHLVASDSR